MRVPRSRTWVSKPFQPLRQPLAVGGEPGERALEAGDDGRVGLGVDAGAELGAQAADRRSDVGVDALAEPRLEVGEIAARDQAVLDLGEPAVELGAEAGEAGVEIGGDPGLERREVGGGGAVLGQAV